MNNKSFFYHLILTVTIILVVTSCEQVLVNDIESVNTNPILDEQFRSYEIVEIDNEVLWNTVEQQIDGVVDIEMRRASTDPVLAKWSAKMSREQFLADDFTSEAIDASGQLTPIPMAKMHFVRGELDQQNGSISIAITEDEFNAFIKEGDNSYFIEPLSDYISNTKPNEYLKYNLDDVIQEEEHSCGSTALPAELPPVEMEHVDNLTNNEDLEDRAPKCRKATITVMGDLSLSHRFANRQKAMLWMRKRIWAADKFYKEKNNFPLDFIIKKVYLKTNSPISTSNESLKFLRTWRKFGNDSPWIVKNDINILFTARSFGDNTDGRAYIKAVCSNPSHSYGFVRKLDITNANRLTAHEIGHLFGANHTPSGFMKKGTESFDMHPTTRNELNAHINSNNGCLGYWNCN